MDLVEIPVPGTIEDVTLPWLQQVFKLKNIQVNSFELVGDARDGRGYLSSLNRLTLQVQKEGQTTPTPLSIIIKTVPTDPQVYSYVVRVGYFANEFEMYTRVLPTLNAFLDERGVSPENRFNYPVCYYGAADGDCENYKCVLVLEDLQASGYQCPNVGVTKSFNAEETKVALREIALFHASSLAYKRATGLRFFADVFTKLVKHDINEPMVEHYVKLGLEVTKKLLLEGQAPVPDGLLQRLDEIMITNFKPIAFRYFLPTEANDFYVIRHADLWYSNVSFLRDESGTVTKAEWFDFQNCSEGSIMMDVAFFLILNCDTELSTTRMEEMITHYHEAFTNVIMEAKIDLEYPLERMVDEFKEYRMAALLHIISGAPNWCCTNELSKQRLQNAILYAYTSGELEIPKFEK